MLFLGGLFVLLGSLYLATQHTVQLDLNGVRLQHRTHQRSAEGILRELNLTLMPEDQLESPGEEALRRGEPLRIQLARLVTLIHDGSVTQLRTQAATVGEALAQTDLTLLPHDRLFLAGKPCEPTAPLPPLKPTSGSNLHAVLQALRRPVRITIERAVELSVQDGTVPLSFYTTARTLGEALYERGVMIYAEDRIVPELATPITPGLTAFIERSKAVLLDIGGKTQALRTRLSTVQELLDAQGITLGPKDYVQPDPRTAISRDLRIKVVQVHDEYYIQEIPIPFEVRHEPDPELELDQSRVAHWGNEGARRQRIRAHYESGQLVYETEEEEWLSRQPHDRIIKYGTKIVLRQLETPSGTVTYWRKLRVLATSYNAPTAGTSTSSPYYGFTRLGWRARKGIIAVDPSIIKLGQPVYVPDYGQAVAADTGGAIKGRHIDLCFDDDNLEFWYRWTDVYLLEPVPGDIVWTIPNSPQEKD